MDGYHIKIAVNAISVCGLFSFAYGIVMKVLDREPTLTPTLQDMFSWWPTDLLVSSMLIGMPIGITIALLLIGVDIYRKKTLNYDRRH